MKTFTAVLIMSAMAALVSGAARAEDVCENPSRTCGARISPGCLEKFGAGTLPVAAQAECGGQFEEYRACLVEVVSQCGGAAPAQPAAVAPSAGCDAQTGRELWAMAEQENDCAAFDAFLRACPNSPRAAFAEDRRRRLNCAIGQGQQAASASGGLDLALGERALDLLKLQNGVHNGQDTRGVDSARPVDFVFFDRDSADISPQMRAVLREQAARIEAYLTGRKLSGVSDPKIQLISHCATDEANKFDLCETRPLAVRLELEALDVPGEAFEALEMLGSQAMLAYGPELQSDPVNRYVWMRFLD